MKYTAPDKKLSAFTCPHCGVYAQMKYSEHNFKEDEICITFDECIDTNTTTLARCANCGNKIIWIKDEYVYPNLLPISPNEDMPNVVKVLYEEAGLIYTKSPRAACALLRLAIDRLCNELGETDRDINKNIASLVKRGLSVEVQRAFDIVRVVGNKAVHPGQIDFDIDNIETTITLFNLVNFVVDELISKPNRIKELYNTLPQSAREAIDKRDNKR